MTAKYKLYNVGLLGNLSEPVSFLYLINLYTMLFPKVSRDLIELDFNQSQLVEKTQNEKVLELVMCDKHTFNYKPRSNSILDVRTVVGYDNIYKYLSKIVNCLKDTDRVIVYFQIKNNSKYPEAKIDNLKSLVNLILNFKLLFCCNVKYLEFNLYGGICHDEDSLDLILSLSYLTKISFNDIDLRNVHLSELQSCYGLEEVHFNKAKFSYWSFLMFPPSLKRLTLSFISTEPIKKIIPVEGTCILYLFKYESIGDLKLNRELEYLHLDVDDLGKTGLGRLLPQLSELRELVITNTRISFITAKILPKKLTKLNIINERKMKNDEFSSEF
ncbi:hypothetical protein DFJ63DRAFT_123955 [Scheffersomyces coipomensis]|uniref:uncharacterized protein n=1 Tax=Scheffersomyces coipomensis TaxID=1788519 RepID=UPI00315D71B6